MDAKHTSLAPDGSRVMFSSNSTAKSLCLYSPWQTCRSHRVSSRCANQRKEGRLTARLSMTLPMTPAFSMCDSIIASSLMFIMHLRASPAMDCRDTHRQSQHMHRR